MRECHVNLEWQLFLTYSRALLFIAKETLIYFAEKSIVYRCVAILLILDHYNVFQCLRVHPLNAKHILKQNNISLR